MAQSLKLNWTGICGAILFTLTLTLVSVSRVLAASWIETLPLTPNSAVIDQAGILTLEQEKTLESKLAALRPEAEMAVVIVKSLEGNEIADLAQLIFTRWGLGSKTKNNGLLLLVAMDERRTRIQTGYGLEPIIPDLMAARLLDQQLTPAFRAGDYTGGILAVIAQINQAVKSGMVLDLSSNQNNSNNSGPDALWWIFFLFPLLSLIFNPILWWLGKSKSWWLGGLLTGGIASIIVLILGISLFTGIFMIIGAAIFGWVLDLIAGQMYQYKRKKFGSDRPWWILFPPFGGGGSGSGFGGGSSFGGFGGGSSGGGGAGGSW